jgi:hypothetical protein
MLGREELQKNKLEARNKATNSLEMCLNLKVVVTNEVRAPFYRGGSLGVPSSDWWMVWVVQGDIGKRKPDLECKKRSSPSNSVGDRMLRSQTVAYVLWREGDVSCGLRPYGTVWCQFGQ